MASVFKPAGADKWMINFTDQHGKRRKKIGYPDKKRTDRLAAKLEEEAREVRDGLRDPKAEAYRTHEGMSLLDHLAAFGQSVPRQGSDRQTRPHDPAAHPPRARSGQGQAHLRPVTLEGPRRRSGPARRGIEPREHQSPYPRSQGVLTMALE